LSTDWQTTKHPDREQVSKARMAAEALFRPKQQGVHVEPPIATSTPPLDATTSRREPRIIAMPMREVKADASTDPEPKPRGEPIKQRASEVPASQHDRIRALTGYGMTLEQVADLYAVPVGEIKRIVGSCAP
jgi:hypothetical protein